MPKYETILINILKAVNRINKHPLQKQNTQSINSFLYTMGVGAQWNVRTFDHPLSNDMRKAAQKLINAAAHTYQHMPFTRSDIKPLADTLYNWGRAVKNAPRKPYEK